MFKICKKSKKLKIYNIYLNRTYEIKIFSIKTEKRPNPYVTGILTICLCKAQFQFFRYFFKNIMKNKYFK